MPCHSMSRDCIRAEPIELSARQRRLTGVARRIAALDSWREIIHEPDLLAGTLADLPRDPEASDKPSDNGPRQRQTEPDVPRHWYLLWPAVIRLNAMPSEETGMHGKEKVYGSIP